MLSEKPWGAVGIPVYSKSNQQGLKSAFCTAHSSFIFTLANHVFMKLGFCTGTISCWNMVGFSKKKKRNLNTTEHKDILINCVLSILWQQIGDGLLIGVMVRCPHTFDHVYNLYINLHMDYYVHQYTPLHRPVNVLKSI